jgi:hypothetical protein
MSTREEIMHLEERLRQAKLAPDPCFFQEYLADRTCSSILRSGITTLSFYLAGTQLPNADSASS